MLSDNLTLNRLKTLYRQNITYDILPIVLRVLRSRNNVKLILLGKIEAWAKEIHVIKEFGVRSPRLGD